jgi:hypothetical protein
MSCPICFEAYDDVIDEQRCYIICSLQGHSTCKACMIRLGNACPICRGPTLNIPLLARINNVAQNQEQNQEQTHDQTQEQTQDQMDVVPSNDVLMLIDRSGSMGCKSGQLQDAPDRIELAAHMAKIIHAFCKKLGVKCHMYTFAAGLNNLDINERISQAQLDRVLHAIEPDGGTNLGLALKQLYAKHGANCNYFVFTDGDPSDTYEDSIKLFVDTQLHLISFSDATSRDLLRAVANNRLHTISYIEDIRSLSGYMIPVFIWSMTGLSQVTLAEADDECRKKFIEILEPQVLGNSNSYRLTDLVELLKRYSSDYVKDLLVDTAGTIGHSRIEYSFKPENWNNFGKYYLQCILHCHKYLIPGNMFDPSLRFYRTKEYNKIYEKIADIPSGIKFVSFMTRGSAQAYVSAAASNVVQSSFQSADTYWSTADDGCIGPDALVDVTNNYGTVAKVPMKHIRPGDILSGSRVKWIIRVKNLNRGNPIPLYNGLTSSHPVHGPDGWIKAKHYPGATLSFTTGIVYDVVLDSNESMYVNGCDAATVGVPIPGMVHPYWGSHAVISDIESRYPGGGFVDVDASDFSYDYNGLVSSLGI